MFRISTFARWILTFSGTNHQYDKCRILYKNNYLYILNQIVSASTYLGGLLVKCDINGNIIWSKVLYSGYSLVLNDIAVDNNENCYLVGRNSSNLGCLIKYDMSTHTVVRSIFKINTSTTTDTWYYDYKSICLNDSYLFVVGDGNISSNYNGLCMAYISIFSLSDLSTPLGQINIAGNSYSNMHNDCFKIFYIDNKIYIGCSYGYLSGGNFTSGPRIIKIPCDNIPDTNIITITCDEYLYENIYTKGGVTDLFINNDENLKAFTMNVHLGIYNASDDTTTYLYRPMIGIANLTSNKVLAVYIDSSNYSLNTTVIDSNGNVYVGGQVVINNIYYALYAKFTSTGTLVWQKGIKTTNNAGIAFNSSAIDENDNIYFYDFTCNVVLATDPSGAGGGTIIGLSDYDMVELTLSFIKKPTTSTSVSLTSKSYTCLNTTSIISQYYINKEYDILVQDASSNIVGHYSNF